MIRNYIPKPYISPLLFTLLSFLLSACNNSNTHDSAQLQGSAVKGVIQNGILNAYSVNPVDQEMTLLDSTRTDQDGGFTLNLESNSSSEFLLLELSSDQNTHMTCDVVSGCTHPISGSHADFGDALPLGEEFTLLGTVNPSNPNTAYLSPLSHIIISTAAALPNGLNTDNVALASSWLRDSLDLQHSPLSTQTADLTRLNALINLSDAALLQGIYSAAFFDLSFGSAWTNGELNLDTLPYDELFARANMLSEALLDYFASDQHNYAGALATISSDTQALYDQVSNEKLQILAQPGSIQGTEGDHLTLRVQTTGTGPISYQWYKGANPIAGANDTTFTIAQASIQDSGIYSVRISNEFSSIHSLNALISVEEAITALHISQQPVSASLTTGQQLHLSVIASGEGPLSYQWQKGGTLIPGATSANFQINAVDTSDAGSYSVMISDQYTQISSQQATVYVNESVEAISITKQPVSLTTIAGSDATFSVHVTGGGFLRFQWRIDGINIPNENDANLSLSAVDLSQAGSYDVVISNSLGSIQSSPATLTILPNQVPIAITQQPQSVTVNQGESALFTVSAQGGSGLSYQWYHNGSALTGATQSSYRVIAANASDEGVYSVDVSSGSDRVSSMDALLSLNDSANLQLSWQVPNERENGEALALADISGYQIQYGYSTAASLDNTAHIDGALTTEYELSNLHQGRLLLRIATVDSSGIRGNYSETIAVDIP